MADIFDEILGPGADPSALASVLRRKNTLGQLAQLSGDRVLGPMGQQLQEGAVGEATGARRLADQRAAEASLAQYRQGTLDAGNKDRALRQSIAQANNARALEVAKIMSQRQHALSAAQQATQDRFKQTQLNQLAGRLDTSNLGIMADAVRKAQAVLDKYPQGDIPGVGGIENIRKGGIGTLATYATGSGQEGRQNQADLADFQNMLLRIQSGQAVTDPELQRALVAQGLTEFNTADDLRRILPGIVKQYEGAVNNLLAGYDPTIVDEFKKRGGLSSWDAKPQKAATVGDLDQLDENQLLDLAQQLLNENANSAAE